MFDIMINVLIFALWIGIFLAPTSLFALRLYYVISRKLRGKVALFVLLTPLSIGLQYHAPKGKLKTLYDTFVIAFFVILVLGSFFLFAQYKSM